MCSMVMVMIKMMAPCSHMMILLVIPTNVFQTSE